MAQHYVVEKFSKIPGLQLYHSVFNASMQECLVRNIHAITKQLFSDHQSNSQDSILAHIPQPKSVRSSAHNLAEERFFRPVQVEDFSSDARSMIKCEHFQTYGSDNHSLTYFQRNRNIPLFARRGIIEPILIDMDVVQETALEIGKDLQRLEWRMTMNCYSAENANTGVVNASTAHGHTAAMDATLFPFHIDIPQNGIITMVLTLGSQGCIQFAATDEYAKAHQHESPPTEDCPETIVLPTGSMLVASGPSRWDFMHRVIAATSENDLPRSPRYSLVFGCQ